MKRIESLEFESQQDAITIAEQIGGAVRDKELILPMVDRAALITAMQLARIEPKQYQAGEGGPRIYIACLNAYNSGFLHGIWLDATEEIETMQAAIRWMLLLSPAPDQYTEGWRIDDYENFAGIEIYPHESLDKIQELAGFAEEHGEAAAAYIDHYGNGADIEKFEDFYIGEYENEADFVEKRIAESGLIKRVEQAGLNPCYIDVKSMAYDWFINDYWSHQESYNSYHIFYR